MEETIHKSGNGPQEYGELVQTSALALQRCEGEVLLEAERNPEIYAMRDPVQPDGACGDLGWLAEYATKELGTDVPGVDPNTSEENPATECKMAALQPTREQSGRIPDFATLLRVNEHDAVLFEALWMAIQTPRDYTTPDTALVESLLQTLHQDSLITPRAIADDLRRYHEDFEDCRRISARMRTAEAAGVRDVS